MKIQYASDLHLEFQRNRNYLVKNPLKVVGDILLLGGDIGELTEEYIRYPFWDWVSDNFSHTLIVPGNHEFYRNSMLDKMSNGYISPIRENVQLCYNTLITIGNIDFILTTLWGYIPKQLEYITQKNVSDFKLIRCAGKPITTRRFNAEHLKAIQFLKEAFSISKAAKRVVVSHHLPTELCMASEFKGSIINGAFVSEHYDLISESPIDYWIYGHSHRNNPLIDIKGTKLLCNQMGYIHSAEQTTFDPGAFFLL